MKVHLVGWSKENCIVFLCALFSEFSNRLLLENNYSVGFMVNTYGFISVFCSEFNEEEHNAQKQAAADEDTKSKRKKKKKKGRL